jgi:DNA polymerase-3 subunit delta
VQLRPEQLAAHLDKPLAPLYLLHGDEPLLVIEAADAIRAAARKQGFEEREVIVAGTGFKWDDLFMAAGNMSLFGGSKLVDLRIPSGKPGREGSEALQRYIGTLGPRHRHPDHPARTRLAGEEGRLGHGAVERRRRHRMQRAAAGRLPQWIAERMARQKQSAPRPRWSSSPPTSKATCSPPTRKSRSWACSIRPAKSRWQQVEAAR